MSDIYNVIFNVLSEFNVPSDLAKQHSESLEVHFKESDYEQIFDYISSIGLDSVKLKIIKKIYNNISTHVLSFEEAVKLSDHYNEEQFSEIKSLSAKAPFDNENDLFKTFLELDSIPEKSSEKITPEDVQNFRKLSLKFGLNALIANRLIEESIVCQKFR